MRGRRAGTEGDPWLESIIEIISHIVYIKDLQGRYLLMNSAGEALFDRPHEEIIGKHDRELFSPEAAEEIRRVDEAVMRTQEPRTYESRREVQGEERVFRNEKHPYLAEDGSVRGVIGISRDITDEKDRERALRQLHKATRALLTATTRRDIAEIMSDTAASVLDLPTNTVHLFDAEADALVPEAWSDPGELIVDDRPPAFESGEGLAWDVFATGEPRSYADVRAEAGVFNDETEIRSEIILPLGDHGVLMLGSTEVDDFAERDEALASVLAANVEAALDRLERERELRRRNERLEDFADVLSHDVRNPLNVAQVRADLLEEEDDSEHLDRLRGAHDRIEAVIEDVQVWAREGQTIEDTERVDLAQLARNCWEAVSAESAALEVDERFYVEADRDRLARVLDNLFRNAVEHGGPSVTVRVGRLGADAGFYVSDSGPGIAEDRREDVFGTGYSTSEAGTGFGLAICKEIAEAHGWSLRLTEGPDGGARFEFSGVTVHDDYSPR